MIFLPEATQNSMCRRSPLSFEYTIFRIVPPFETISINTQKLIMILHLISLQNLQRRDNDDLFFVIEKQRHHEWHGLASTSARDDD